MVHLPATYRDSRFDEQCYPVFYVLDAAWDYPPLAAAVDFLSSGMLPRIPEAIVIGVYQHDRTNELTPASAIAQTQYPTGGGAEVFGRFLTEELVAHIDSTYRTSGTNALFGHSFGGLFALDHVLNGSRTFRMVAASDPSVWWDEWRLLSQLPRLQQNLQDHAIRLYVARAGHAGNANPDSVAIIRANRQLANQLAALDTLRWRIGLQEYAEEDHATVNIHAQLGALNWLFAGYKMDFDAFENPHLLVEHYRELSSRHGDCIKPSLPLLVAWMDFFLEQGNLDDAAYLWRFAKAAYPGNELLMSSTYHILCKNW